MLKRYRVVYIDVMDLSSFGVSSALVGSKDKSITSI